MTIRELEGFYKGKRVLVTGHTGFKGAWLCRMLGLAGAQVTGYALSPPTDPSLFEIAGLEDCMDSVIGDIRDLKHLREVFDRVRPEVVFHLAAQPIVRDSYKDPVYTYETNVMGTVNVLECVRLTKSVRSFLNVTMIRCMRTGNGSMVTGNVIPWTGMIRIPIVNPARNW